MATPVSPRRRGRSPKRQTIVDTVVAASAPAAPAPPAPKQQQPAPICYICRDAGSDEDPLIKVPCNTCTDTRTHENCLLRNTAMKQETRQIGAQILGQLRARSISGYVSVTCDVCRQRGVTVRFSTNGTIVNNPVRAVLRAFASEVYAHTLGPVVHFARQITVEGLCLFAFILSFAAGTATMWATRRWMCAADPPRPECADGWLPWSGAYGQAIAGDIINIIAVVKWLENPIPDPSHWFEMAFASLNALFVPLATLLIDRWLFSAPEYITRLLALRVAHTLLLVMLTAMANKAVKRVYEPTEPHAAFITFRTPTGELVRPM